MEHPDSLPPIQDCRCVACYRAREDSVPAKLRYLMRRQLHISVNKISPSDALIHRAVSTYLAGHIGLAEMQIELIAGLAQQVDQQHEKIMDVVMREPLLATKQI